LHGIWWVGVVRRHRWRRGFGSGVVACRANLEVDHSWSGEEGGEEGQGVEVGDENGVRRANCRGDISGGDGHHVTRAHRSRPAIHVNSCHSPSLIRRFGLRTHHLEGQEHLLLFFFSLLVSVVLVVEKAATKKTTPIGEGSQHCQFGKCAQWAVAAAPTATVTAGVAAAEGSARRSQRRRSDDVAVGRGFVPLGEGGGGCWK